MKNRSLYILRRLILVLLGAVLMAFNINTFVKAGGLIPGGFTGLTILIQEICYQYGGFRVPFSLVNYALNAVPAMICFFFVGRKFTMYSILMVLVCGLLTDWMPRFMPGLLLDFLMLHDSLLSAVFGGFLNALAIALCLHADATSGGTDFIAIFLSEKYRKDAWNYIFVGNCVVLLLAGVLFGLNMALYSIIFQFTTTVSLRPLYRKYQQMTLLIITNKPDDVYAVINRMTHHGATRFNGRGVFENKERTMLYSVVTASQVKTLIPAIKKIDDDVFVNVIRTEQLNGRFYKQPQD